MKTTYDKTLTDIANKKLENNTYTDAFLRRNYSQSQFDIKIDQSDEDNQIAKKQALDQIISSNILLSSFDAVFDSLSCWMSSQSSEDMIIFYPCDEDSKGLLGNQRKDKRTKVIIDLDLCHTGMVVLTIKSQFIHQAKITAENNCVSYEFADLDYEFELSLNLEAKNVSTNEDRIKYDYKQGSFKKAETIFFIDERLLKAHNQIIEVTERDRQRSSLAKLIRSLIKFREHRNHSLAQDIDTSMVLLSDNLVADMVSHLLEPTLECEDIDTRLQDFLSSQEGDHRSLEAIGEDTISVFHRKTYEHLLPPIVEACYRVWECYRHNQGRIEINSNITSHSEEIRNFLNQFRKPPIRDVSSFDTVRLTSFQSSLSIFSVSPNIDIKDASHKRCCLIM